MRNILITGGAGFIGSNFVRYLLQTEPEIHIVNLDVLSYAGSQENLKDLPHPQHHTFVRGDICDQPLVDHLFHFYKIDTVVHFAAETHVDRSILFPEQFVRTNVIGTVTLLEAARQYWLQEKHTSTGELRFHHVSTDEVYGTLAPDEPAWTEQTPYAPSSPYSASKAASDHFVRSYGHTYGLPFSISHCTNNYGPYQFPEKLIPLMILNAVDGIPLPIYGDGAQIRDWLYVEDHCEAIGLILRKGRQGETYHIAAGSQPTNLEVVQHLCSALDELLPESPSVPHASLMRFVPDRPGHDRRYALDITKITTELGWHSTETLGSGLHKTIQWYLSHPEWVSAIRQQQDYQQWLERNYDKRQ
jgi:dTDP-glucose 4,6-dehydratase